VGQDSEVYVGLDTSKLKISVAIADAGRAGEVRFFGDINSTPEAVERLVTKLSKRHSRLTFCYEAALTPSPTATAGRIGEEVIPIVEERLRVGKRDVERGRVRVRSYIVETPVEEQVTLRSEHVELERRPVDRELTAADTELFRERTIEATETAEEAVIAKDVRVKEELVLRKGVVENVETVRDTVRRTEVEVEDNVTHEGHSAAALKPAV
jgi:uncharacterized protein (TIGR02271 family)